MMHRWRWTAFAALVVASCSSQHDVATFNKESLESACESICDRYDTCNEVFPPCSEGKCTCLSGCEQTLSDGLDLENEFCQDMLDTIVECARVLSCSELNADSAPHEPECERMARAQLACYGEGYDEPAEGGSGIATAAVTTTISTSTSSSTTGDIASSASSGGAGFDTLREPVLLWL